MRECPKCDGTGVWLEPARQDATGEWTKRPAYPVRIGGPMYDDVVMRTIPAKVVKCPTCKGKKKVSS